MTLIRCLFLSFALLHIAAQPRTHATATDQFQVHYNRAIAYSDISLYAPCIEELNSALELATKNKLKEQRITVTISLAEVMRKTRDFDKALNLLIDLHIPSGYPKLQVRKLGRIAAIYNEWLPSPHINQTKLVSQYLDSALRIATALNLKEEQAGLYNELGYTISSRNRNTGLAYLLRSAALYQELKDTHNYVGAMTNVLRSYLVLNDTAKALSLIQKLLPLTQGRHWYTAETELYNQVEDYYKLLGDSLSAARFSSMSDKSIISNLSSINTTQMNAFRTLYETKKLREQVAVKQQALNRQARRTRELVLYLSLLALLVMGVIALLLRERALKHRLKIANSQLQVSNQKYHMLIEESNHRIKNNLQMVISMIEYSANQPGINQEDAFKRMSGKIQTISSLHKHLSIDAHNELVAMDVYFNEIIQLYKNITQAVPSVLCNVAPVKIRSERIVYFGLILNEMLANTIEHSQAQNSEVKISVNALPNGYQFDYQDGSVCNPSAEKGMGSTLIRQLIQRVGGTQFTFQHTTGHYQFRFHE